ncbi:MAG TPA: NADH-quinone oxidoreductase subunit J [Acidimicrobiales bacterium]|nr:NADH-quinone oxidoreductase subunit J [Acidimicrobiales bacterium]
MLAATRSVPDVLVFIASTAIILGGAVGVVISKNPVHSAINLIATLLGVALAFVEQQAHFLAAVQIIVYAGAIVILFLFVIMFLGVDRDDQLRVEPLAGQRPMAVLAVGVVTGGLIALMAAGGWYSGAHSVAAPTDPSNDVGVLGRTIFTTYLFAFEATALLLIIAVVGAVLLARRGPVAVATPRDEAAPATEGPVDAGRTSDEAAP